MPEVDVLAASDLGPNEVTLIEIDGHPAIALYNLDGEFFATDDLCSHGDASLAEGDIEDGEILCPFHLGSFDIRTGEARQAPCITPIRTHPVKVEGDRIILVLED
ncbi:MAG: non-heme iron oxygenase ferredoxin subunit [Pseudomonadota bacterium]